MKLWRQEGKRVVAILHDGNKSQEAYCAEAEKNQVKDVNFDYFPFEVEDKLIYTYEVAELINPSYEIWKIEKEMTMLDMDLEELSVQLWKNSCKFFRLPE